MNDVRSIVVLCVALMCLLETCTPLLFDLNPGRFARERYQRSRNKTTTRSINVARNSPQVLDFVALVNRFGYPAEEHLITTVDGYRLRIHRIPGSPQQPSAEGKPVVFFQHGLLASSDTWVFLGPEKNLAYTLADMGYDIWMGNARGNTYSRSHVRLSPDYDPEFWQFSFHEIALFDVTAAIDYILQVTGQKSVIYIGHSMGTTISYVLLSTRPEYNEKIRMVISMAPVALWKAPNRPFIKFLIENTESIKNFVYSARMYELFPLTAANAQLSRTACTDGSVLQQLCLNMIYYVSGYNPSQLNTTALPYFLSFFPSGASTLTLHHYSQNMGRGNFNMFDYGLIQNFATYKQSDAPAYNLKNIVTPVALFYGKGDVIVAPGNAIELSKKLPNLVTIEAIADERFSHLDFLFANDIKSLVNDRVVEVMTQFLRYGKVL